MTSATDHRKRVKVFQTVVANDNWKADQEPDQRKAFFATWREVFGKLEKSKERSVRLTLLSALFGCPIGTSGQLTKFEIGALIDLLKKEPVWIAEFSSYLEDEFSGKPQDFCPRPLINELGVQPAQASVPELQFGDPQPAEQHGDARAAPDTWDGFPISDTDGDSIPSL